MSVNLNAKGGAAPFTGAGPVPKYPGQNMQNQANMTANPGYQGATYGGSQNAPQGMVGIRSYLNQMGYKGPINWNPVTGNPAGGLVGIGNGSTAANIQPGANVGGTTYATPQDIIAALNGTGYQSQDQQSIDQAKAGYLNSINTPNQAVNTDMMNLTNATNAPPPSLTNPNANYMQAANAAAQTGMNAVDNTTLQKLGTLGMSSVGAQALQGANQDIYNQDVLQALPNMYNEQYQQYQGNINNQANLLNTQNTLGQQNVGNQQGALNTLGGLQNTEINQQIAQQNAAATQAQKYAEANNYQYTAAINSVKALGYTDDQAAQMLGIPAGTQSQQGTYQDQQLQDDLAKLAISQQNANTTQTRASDTASLNAAKLGDTTDLNKLKEQQMQLQIQNMQNQLNSPAQSSAQTQAKATNTANKLLTSGAPLGDGKPMTIPQIQQWAYQNADYLASIGCTPADVMTIATQINDATLGTQPGWYKFLKAGQL